MTDTRDDSWLARQAAPHAPRLDLLRTLWVMTRPSGKPITAAIYATAFGRELRVHAGDPDDLRDSLLSRTGDAPLEQRAAELHAVLVAAGWALADA